MMRRLLWVISALSLLAFPAASAYASGGSSASTWAKQYKACRARMVAEGVGGYLAADEICHGALKPSEAVTATLDSIDSGAFDIATRLRKYVYGGAYPSAFAGGIPTLFAAALTFLLIWYGVQIIFTASDDSKGTSYLLSTILKGLLFGSLLLWLMYYYIPVMRSVDAGINWLSSVFLNQGSAPDASSGLGTYITYGTQSFVGVTMEFFHLRPPFPSGASWYDIGPIFPWLASMVLWFIPIVLLIVEMILFVGLGILAQVLFAIAVAFGPLMLVLSLLPFARRLAQSWGNFLLSAGFYKLVLAAIVGLGGSVFIQSISLLHDLEKTLAQQNSNPGLILGGSDLYKLLIFAAVCLLLFALILAMFSASRISNHLITGFGTFDIGTAGTGSGPNLGRGGGQSSNSGSDSGSGDRGERWESPTSEESGASRTKAGAGEGGGERDIAPVVEVDTDGGDGSSGDDESGSGDDESVSPGQGDADPDAPVGGDHEAPVGEGGASHADQSGAGAEAETSGDRGGQDAGASENGGGTPAGSAGTSGGDEGYPTSNEEPPPPDDSEIPPESDGDEKDPTL